MFCQKCGTQNPDNGRFCRSCGTDLGNTAALASTQQAQQGDYYIDHKGRKRSNNPHDIRSQGIKGIVTGIGFLIVACALLFTGVAGGHGWWWAMLFPAFGSMANGFAQLGRARSIESQQKGNPFQQPQQFSTPQGPPQNAPLPPTQNDYITPQPPRSIYDTGEFETRPPSVTEGTTRHLDINKENETMTLPNRNDL